MKETSRSLAFVSVLVVGCPTPSLAQDPQPEDGAVTELATEGFLYDDAKAVGFPKPVDWKFAKRISNKITDAYMGSVVALASQMRTVDYGNIYLDVYILNGSCPTLRLQAIYEMYGKIAAGHAVDDSYSIMLDPLPHATYRLAKNPDETVLMVHQRANGRAMTVMYQLPNTMLLKARPVLLQLAQKVEVKLPLWPVREAAYNYQEESGFEVAFADGIDKRHRSSMRKQVKSVVKDFTKAHGKPVFVDGDPVVIYVERDPAKRAELLGLPGEEVGFHLNVGLRRLVTPVVVAADPEGRANFSGVLYGYLLSTLYPDETTKWMRWGEKLVARMKARTGKALPWVPGLWAGDLQRVPASFEDTLAAKGGIGFAETGAWVAFFRLGASKYRKAYSAYLEELRTGHEQEAALATLRKACDSDNLWRDARKLLGRKLKVVKK